MAKIRELVVAAINKAVDEHREDLREVVDIAKLTHKTYLDTDQAGLLTSISPKTLRAMRSADCGPTYVKLGKEKRSKVVYSRVELLAWVDDQKILPSK